MSQQHPQHADLPLPPPPPPPPPSSSSSGARSGAALPVEASISSTLRAVGAVPRQPLLQRSRPVSTHLPSISTTFVNVPSALSSQAVATPISAPHLTPPGHLPYSPAAHAAVGVATPTALRSAPPGASSRPSIMEPYNPRQWSPRGQVSGSQMLFQQRQNPMPVNSSQVTGMEANMPSPPPPYSPSTPDNIARAIIASSTPDHAAIVSSPLVESFSRNSPQVPMSPAFPPPPGQSSRHRERSASGLGSNRGFFSLSVLRGKQPAQPDMQQFQPSTMAFAQSLDEGGPPAARRAASTGHVRSAGAVASSSAAASVGRASPDNGWQPGMPLPGPPPGPPPPGARSQSLNRPVGVSRSGRVTPEHGQEAPRPRAAAAPSLAPVPPTPANWVDGEAQDPVPQQSAPQPAPAPSDTDAQPLRIDTGAVRESSLTRRPATREPSAQGIRERRSMSRAAKGTSEDASGPSNLVFSPVSGSISRRREHTRTMSGYAESSSAPGPSMEQARSKQLPGNVITPPYTPAVGKQATGSLNKHMRVPGSAGSDRPISHLLHTPNENAGTMPAPLSPARPPTSSSAKASPRLDVFALQAIERHRTFIEREMAASTDSERLELFTNFIVHESRLRRDKYNIAYNAMAGDIVDLTRDMWRSYHSRNSRRAATPSTSMSSTDPAIPSWASDGLPTPAHGNAPSSASSLGEFTPATDTASMADPTEGFMRSEERPWAEAYRPSLSPIPSMAVSTVLDEASSRGRQPSRWWEASNSGAGSVGRPDRMQKTRRETKYMGVDLTALQAGEDDPARRGPPEERRHAYAYGADEYPPEKVGWHDSHDYDTPMATPQRPGELGSSTPGLGPLDVSRLVTLPPPYPRHHPAVSNNHPHLTDLRADHRYLADHVEIQKIKDAYLNQDFTLSREQQEAVKHRRAELRAEIQSKIADGTMSFAEAASAESDFDAEEAERGKATARSNFDVFEASFSHPLNTLLTERLSKANAAIQQLRSELESGRDSSNPNRAQEEGDEHPERLERLTLLKWLFEAREQLHKEMFDLHAMRSEKYAEVILTPYRIQKSQAKIDEAATFFKKDSWERQTTFAMESLKRFEELQTMMEDNVSRGVEDQLSAFWDIAPGLLEVIQYIPADMSRFEIQIPFPEYDENPSYREHPLQYLYSLLGHAEKSAYQFIESQTNLLCLLHEVRTATTKCRLRLIEIERLAASPDDDAEIHAEMEQARREADDHLTRDLKEKVREVEAQWREALGGGMKDCKQRVSTWLEETGGLEDGLDG